MRHGPSESADGHSPIAGRIRTWHRVSASTPCGDRVAGSFARPCTQALAPGGKPPTAPRRVCEDGPRGPTAHVCRDPSIGALMLGRGSAALDAATPDGSHRPAALSGPTRDDHAGRVLEWPDALRSRRREAPGAPAWGSIRRAGPGWTFRRCFRLHGQASAPNPPGGIGMTVAAEVPEQPSNEKWALAGQPKVS